MTNTAKRLKVNPGLVSIVVKRLTKKGIVKSGVVDLTDPETRGMKIMFNVHRIAPLVGKLRGMLRAKGIGMYGSWAKGTNTGKSDVDLWFKVKEYPKASDAARLRSYIRMKVGSEPGLLFLTEDKANELRKENPPLYYSLYHSFLLWGENID